MPMVRVITTRQTYQLPAVTGETLLALFRRNNLPIQGSMIIRDQKFVSLAHALESDDEIAVYSLRNIDFECIMPRYTLITAERPVTEIMRPLQNPKHLALRQFSREGAMQYIYDSVSSS